MVTCNTVSVFVESLSFSILLDKSNLSPQGTLMDKEEIQRRLYSPDFARPTHYLQHGPWTWLSNPAARELLLADEGIPTTFKGRAGRLYYVHFKTRAECVYDRLRDVGLLEGEHFTLRNGEALLDLPSIAKWVTDPPCPLTLLGRAVSMYPGARKVSVWDNQKGIARRTWAVPVEETKK